MRPVILAVDLVVLCTSCDWSRYAVSGVDEPPEDTNSCPSCGEPMVAVPSPRSVLLGGSEPEPEPRAPPETPGPTGEEPWKNAKLN